MTVGSVVLLADPQRQANKVFAGISLLGLAWLGLITIQRHVDNPIPWMRANALVSPWSAFALSLLHASVAHAGESWTQLLRRASPWAIFAISLSPLCFLDSFASADVSTGISTRGMAYGVHSASLALAHASILAIAFPQLRALSGKRKQESKALVVNVAIGSVACVALICLGNLLHSDVIKAIGLFTIFATYAAIAWAIGTKNIYCLTGTFQTAVYRIALTFAAATAAIATYTVSKTILTPRSAVIATAVACMSVIAARKANGIKLRLLSQRSRRQRLQQDITTLLSAGESVASTIASLENYLARYTDVPEVSIEFWVKGKTPGIPAPICEMAFKSGWATPELLGRAEQANSRAQFKSRTNHLVGLYLVAPIGPPNPSLKICFSTKHDGTPFTWREIQKLRDAAILINSSLSNLALSDHAALQARAEHLALSTCGLAHDLRNLLTPISSFLVYLEGRFQPGTSDIDGLRVARSAAKSMEDYIYETLTFSKNLHQRQTRVNPAELFADVIGICGSRAEKRQNRLSFSVETKGQLVGNGVLLQRLLVNLVCNAIDASPRGEPVLLAATELNGDLIRVEVTDRGTGFARSEAGSSVEPFFTTKDVGDDAQGFGVGLMICRRIVALHQGVMTVTSDPAKGTTVTVDLPRASVVV